MAGNPTLTTQPSIKARLDARIVVAITRRGWPGFADGRVDRAAAASQDACRALLMTGLLRECCDRTNLGCGNNFVLAPIVQASVGRTGGGHRSRVISHRFIRTG